MSQEEPVSTYEINNLEVGNINGNNVIPLPKVYTQDAIPLSKENIVSADDVKKWPYLKDVEIMEIDADIELLIGVNIPKVMEPWHFINSEGNGLYAVRTLLGWVVNGPMNLAEDEEPSQTKATVNRISAAKIE